MVSFDCVFTNPTLYDGSTPSDPGQYWQFNNETCNYNSGIYAPTTTIASSTDIQVYGSFTAGEVLVAFFLFVLIVIELVKMLAHSFNKINTKKKFLSYSGGDVEVTEDL